MKENWDLNNGIPKGFEPMDLVLYDKIIDSEVIDLYSKLNENNFDKFKIGSQKIVLDSNYSNILIALFKYHKDQVNNPNNRHEDDYIEELKLIRKAQNINQSIYPKHILYCDILTQRTVIAIESFGKTLDYEVNENIKIKDVGEFMVNLINLSNNKEIPADNTFQNLTFDEINGLRLIDVRFDRLYKLITFINEIGIRYLKLKIFDQIESNPLVYELCNKKYEELSDNNKITLLKYFENIN